MSIDTSKPFFVVAKRQKSEIEKALKKEGIPTTEKLGVSAYQLRVRVGSTRLTKTCGSVNNVSYEILDQGIRILAMKGRGPTGGCDPNIFDQMSKLIVAKSGK